MWHVSHISWPALTRPDDAPCLITMKIPVLTLSALFALGCAVALADVPIGPEPPPRDELESAQTLLATAAVRLSSLPLEESSTYGGHIESTIASLDQAVAEAGAAIEAGKKPPGGTTSAATEKAAVPRLPQVAFNAPRTPLVEAVMDMNDALATLVRGLPVTDGHIGVDGIHARILADLGRAGEELGAGVEFYNNRGLAGTAPLAESPPPESMLPTVVASTALSLGLALAGLYWFSRRKKAA
jgi:hypothetical protein